MSGEKPESSDTSATHRFDVVAAASIALLALLFIAYSAFDRRAIMDNGWESATQIAEHTSLVAEGTLDTTRQLLRAMSFLVVPATLKEGANPAHVRSALLKLKTQTSHIMDLLVVDEAGAIRHWTGSGAPPDIRDRDYFTFHSQKASSGLFVGPPALSRVHDKQWFFALSEAIRDDQGRLRYVLVAIVDVALFHERLSVQFKLSSNSQALLADDGTVYARNPDHAQYVGRKISRPRELSSISGSQRTATLLSTSQLDQTERLLAFHHLDNYPLVAVGTIVAADLLGEWRQRALLLAGLWLMLCLAIVWLARRATAISQVQSELANLDDLTGLRNRRSILNTASILERSAAHVGSLSLLMIDIDHFKSINDRFGHQIGDNMLRLVSGVLRTQVRTTDIVGRYGGEEFLVLMPDTGPEGALLVAEKVRRAVAEKVIQPVPVTISVGVATTSENDVTLDRTLSRADAALYAAKAAGRNRVHVAAPQERLPIPESNLA